MNFPHNLWKKDYKTPTAKTYGEYLQKLASWNIIILYHFRFICGVSLQFVFVISIWNKSFFAVFFFSSFVLGSPIPPVSSKQQQRSGKVLALVPRVGRFNSHRLVLFFCRFLIIESKMNFPHNLWKNNYKANYCQDLRGIPLEICFLEHHNTVSFQIYLWCISTIRHTYRHTVNTDSTHVQFHRQFNHLIQPRPSHRTHETRLTHAGRQQKSLFAN